MARATSKEASYWPVMSRSRPMSRGPREPPTLAPRKIMVTMVPKERPMNRSATTAGNRGAAAPQPKPKSTANNRAKMRALGVSITMKNTPIVATTAARVLANSRPMRSEMKPKLILPMEPMMPMMPRNMAAMLLSTPRSTMPATACMNTPWQQKLPKPMAAVRNQKRLVRTASLSLHFLPTPASAMPIMVAGLARPALPSFSPPSGSRPMSPGARRAKIKLRGSRMPSTRPASTRQATRQPYWEMRNSEAGTSSRTPTPMPEVAMPRDRPLWRSNQRGSHAAWALKPINPTPKLAATPQARRNWFKLSTWLTHTSEPLRIRVPRGMVRRGPMVSMSRPAKGPVRDWQKMKMEKMLAATARLQPKSCTRARKKTEKEYQIPKTTTMLVKAKPTMTQPRKNLRPGSFRAEERLLINFCFRADQGAAGDPRLILSILFHNNKQLYTQAAGNPLLNLAQEPARRPRPDRTEPFVVRKLSTIKQLPGWTRGSTPNTLQGESWTPGAGRRNSSGPSQWAGAWPTTARQDSQPGIYNTINFCLLSEIRCKFKIRPVSKSPQQTINSITAMGWSLQSMPATTKKRGRRASSRKGVAIEEAYQRIKEMLYLNQLAPGQKIHSEDMSRRLNISVTPVIQALNRLEASGLVEYIPNKGYFLGEINEQEAKELYEAREALELYIIPKVVENITNKKLEEVRRTFARQRGEKSDQARRQFILVDAEFHLRIAKISGNEVIYRLLKDVFEKIFLKYRPEYLHSDTFKGIYREHKELLEALRLKDVERAQEMTKAHLAAGADRIIQSLRNQSGGGAMLSVDLQRKGSGAGQALQDGLGLGRGPLDELGRGGQVRAAPDHLTRVEQPLFHAPLGPSLAGQLARDQGHQPFQISPLVFQARHLFGPGSAQHPPGVFQRAHDEHGVVRGRSQIGLLHLGMARAFLAQNEAGAHVDTLGAQGQPGGQGAAVAEAAAGDHRARHRLHHLGHQHQGGQARLGRVAAALHPHHRHRVHSQLFGLERVAHPGALVDVEKARFLDLVAVGLRAAAGGLQDVHPALGRGLDKGGDVAGREAGEQRDVDPKGAAGQGAGLGDLLAQSRRVGVDGRGQAGQGPGFGHRAHQLGP
eukprot:TRINITY_DN10274_c0_g2_i2.p1 TRINITY_DN10274_c0_g2~~TRINITY_DN10274_c0_g2_i2.p1  ORF type:complete len:1107 (-),score=291.12 TRINITY_DN10274_c0_g2_i2:149-3469(-)